MGRSFISGSRKEMFRTADLERILTRCDRPSFINQVKSWLRWHFPRAKPPVINISHTLQPTSHTTLETDKEV